MSDIHLRQSSRKYSLKRTVPVYKLSTVNRKYSVRSRGLRGQRGEQGIQGLPGTLGALAGGVFSASGSIPASVQYIELKPALGQTITVTLSNDITMYEVRFIKNAGEGTAVITNLIDNTPNSELNADESLTIIKSEDTFRIL